jgi:hypothetical protein
MTPNPIRIDPKSELRKILTIFLGFISSVILVNEAEVK